MKILVLHGVNMKLLGIRQREIYGDGSYKELVKSIKEYAKSKKVKVKFYQSDEEGKICRKIGKSYKKFDGIIINAGAYTHTSLAILDALLSVKIPTVEVHISDIYCREEYRQNSYISKCAEKVIVGKGFKGYNEGIDYFCNKIIGE